VVITENGFKKKKAKRKVGGTHEAKTEPRRNRRLEYVGATATTCDETAKSEAMSITESKELTVGGETKAAGEAKLGKEKNSGRASIAGKTSSHSPWVFWRSYFLRHRTQIGTDSPR